MRQLAVAAGRDSHTVCLPGWQVGYGVEKRGALCSLRRGAAVTVAHRHRGPARLAAHAAVAQ